MINNKYLPRLAVLLIFIGLIISYEAIFGAYFPRPNGSMGHDYILTIGSFLDGYLWYRNNGILDAPWFTPSFCGGQAFFSDPQSAYYSIPQFITFFTDPVKAVHISFILFAAIGFYSTYIYTRKILAISCISALVAASIFLFNGFYAHRMLVGHYGYQSFMLTPLIAYLLIYRHSARISLRNTLFFGIYAGILIGYWFHSGLTTLIIPAALSVVALATITALRSGDSNIAKTFIARGLVASAIAIGLSLSKLNANFALMSHFSRDYYPLPGISDPIGLVKFIFQALFYSSEHTFQTAIPLWRNMQWSAMPHELAYGMTPLPFVAILIGAANWILSRSAKPSNSSILLHKVLYWVGLFAILCLPVALLIYTPAWNSFLKQLPLVGSTTSPFRWMIIYIPVIAIVTGICIEKTKALKLPISALLLLGIPALNFLEQRDYYQQQNFDPAPFVKFYEEVRDGKIEPQIYSIADPKTDDGRSIIDNSLFLQGNSPMHCYNPVFGYRLEKLNTAPLTEGAIKLITKDRTFNLHNPACLVFPNENTCAPWDAFQLSEADKMTNFAAYKPYAFNKSGSQVIADILTIISLLISIAIAAFGIYYKIRRLTNKNFHKP